MDDISITGLWWLADEPDNQVSGTLSFHIEDGPKLELIGAIGGIKAVQGQTDIGTLFGLGDNKLVTLEGCYTNSLTTSYPGPHSHILGMKRIFVGAHINDNERVFDRVDVSFDYLPEFVNRSTLSSTVHADKTGKKWRGIQAKVDTQLAQKIGPIPDGRISASFGWSQREERFRSLTLEETCFLSLDFNTPIDTDSIIVNYIKPLQDLVTLATDKPNLITKLIVKSPVILNQQLKAASIDVYQLTNASPQRDRTRDTLMRTDMLFILADLKRSKMNNWMVVSKRYKPAVGILFGQRYARVSVENKLLNAVSALEAYHRRRFKNTVIGQEPWSKKKKRITKNMKKNDAAFVNDILQHANEKRLKSRLAEVLAHSGIKEDLVNNEKTWNERIRYYRNVLTHYDPAAPREIIDSDYETIYWLAESLSWVLLACLMVEIGFTKKETACHIQLNRHYAFVKARVHESIR